MLKRDELERLAGVARREASGIWCMAKAGPLIDPFEHEINQVRLSKAADLRIIAELLETLALQQRRPHLSLVK